MTVCTCIRDYESDAEGSRGYGVLLCAKFFVLDSGAAGEQSEGNSVKWHPSAFSITVARLGKSRQRAAARRMVRDT